MKYRRFAALLVVCVVMALTGCQNVRQLIGGQKTGSESDSVSTGYSIYYINNDETELRTVGYQLVSTTEDGIIAECLEALETAPEDDEYKAVIADPVVMTQDYVYDKDTRTLSLYFSESYKDMSDTTEMLVRAAIVKTMTQFSGIVDYVCFNINGAWLADSDGNIMRMKNSDYVVEITTNPENLVEEETGLYFASPDGTGLVKIDTTLKYYKTSSLAAVVLNALIRGPSGNEALAVLSTDTLVRSVYVKDDVCQVDFNQEFLETLNGQGFMLNVYSVVNSLTELEDVESVTITVDGKTLAAAYGAETSDNEDVSGDLDLSGNLIADYDMVVQEQEE